MENDETTIMDASSPHIIVHQVAETVATWWMLTLGKEKNLALIPLLKSFQLPHNHYQQVKEVFLALINWDPVACAGILADEPTVTRTLLDNMIRHNRLPARMYRNDHYFLSSQNVNPSFSPPGEEETKSLYLQGAGFPFFPLHRIPLNPHENTPLHHFAVEVVSRVSARAAEPILTYFAASRRESLRVAVLLNTTKTPTAVVETLADDPSPAVRGAVAGLSSLPTTVVSKLAHDDVWQVRYALVNRATIRTSAANPLGTGTVGGVQRISHPETSDNVYTEMFPLPVLEKLAQDSHPNVRAEVARLVDVSTSPVFLPLSSDPNPRVRQMLAGNVSTPENVIAQLTGDVDVLVRTSALMNEKCPTLALLATARTNPTVKIASIIVCHPNACSQSLWLLSRQNSGGWEAVSETARRHPNYVGYLFGT